MEPQFEDLPPMIVAAMRGTGKHLPTVTDQLWEKFIVWASPKRLLGRHEDVRGVGFLWDDPRIMGPDQRRYDVGVPILPEDVPRIEPPVFLQVTMPGTYMKYRHEGRYQDLGEAYDEAMREVMVQAGLDLLAAPILELYRNSPTEVSVEDLVTDIYFPVIRSS